MFQKTVYVFLLCISFASCLEPYDIDVSDYEDLLVVDALITDEVKNHKVYLSRSVPNLDMEPEVESGALVIITNENNNEEVLTEISPGVYETDKHQFVAKVGGTYTLTIRTREGENYVSKPCTLLPPTQIDKVHYRAAKQWNDDETEELFGVDILVDGTASEDAYLRWIYDEDWKFMVPFPEKMQYNYSLNDWEYINPINVVCWKSSSFSGVSIYSPLNQSSTVINDMKVGFVASEATDKLTVRYSVNVKQMSISKEEYEFWNKLKISSEDVGDVFGTQPFSIKGNIKNVNNPREPVLGYFQSGSVASERIYIDRETVSDMGLPIIKYDHGCHIDTFKVDGFAYSSALQIYEEQVVPGFYQLNDAIYAENGFAVVGLMLARPVCADCSITGQLQQPDFWED